MDLKIQFPNTIYIFTDMFFFFFLLFPSLRIGKHEIAKCAASSLKAAAILNQTEIKISDGIISI